jgi:hypothetical protein
MGFCGCVLWKHTICDAKALKQVSAEVMGSFALPGGKTLQGQHLTQNTTLQQ